MDTIDRHHTLADIVTQAPGTARAMERHGLDYCCGGQRRLDEACGAAGLDVGAVLDELHAAADALGPDAAGAGWASMGPAELVDHLEATHHEYLKREFSRLSALADKVAGVHGDRHPELRAVARTYEELRAELEPHLMKEERVLFPMIRTLAAARDDVPAFHCGSVHNPISVMRYEHDQAGELLAELRRLTDAYTVPSDGCASYEALYRGLAEFEADTHLHIHKENNVLFGAVEALEAALAEGGGAR